jgi:Holliday junction resolvasome RuvABC endonuclease subunit
MTTPYNPPPGRLVPKRTAIKKQGLIVGLDLSLSHTGFVVANKTFKFCISGAVGGYEKQEIEHRIMNLWADIDAQVFSPSHLKIDWAVIEGVSYNLKGQRAAQAAGFHYYVRCQIEKKYPGIKRAYIPATTLKKWVTGDGHAKKNMMLLKCFQRFGFEAPDDDICDAYCLVRYGFEKRKELSKWNG